MKFVINSEPITLRRVRFTKDGETYNSQSDIMNDISFFIKFQYERHCCIGPDYFKTGPIKLDVTFYCKIPNSLSKIARKKLDCSYPTKKKDLDNFIKFICDCLTRSGIITDDSQIAVINAKKVLSFDGRTEFNLERL